MNARRGPGLYSQRGDRAADTPPMTSSRARCNWSCLADDNPLYHLERGDFTLTEGSSPGTRGSLGSEVHYPRGFMAELGGQRQPVLGVGPLLDVGQGLDVPAPADTPPAEG